MRHIIKKQVMDLHVDQKLDGFDIQHRMSALYYEKILPALEKIFDALSDENTVLCVDKLKIDLGHIDASEINEKSRIDQFITDIEEQLFAQLKFTSSTSTTEIIRQHKSLSIFKQWLYYMQRGYLPWNAEGPTKDWNETVLETLAADYHSVDELRILLIAEPKLVERIILQHPIDFLIHVVELFTAKKQTDLPLYIEEVFHSIKFTKGRIKTGTILPEQKLIHRMVWKRVFQIIPLAKADRTTSQIITEIIEQLFDSRQASVIIQSRRLQPKISRIQPTFVKLAELNIKSQKKIKKDLHKIEDAKIDETVDIVSKEDTPVSGPENKIYKDQSINFLQEEVEKSSSQNDDFTRKTIVDKIDESGVFVPNAGIVLLHHFLHRFFKNISLVSDNKFKDGDSTVKAILLLHYLATGQKEAEEYDLVVAKLLCGYLISDPVEKQSKISEEEFREADELLSDLVQQWSILKNTSADGLREAFLQRRGKLYESNERLHLHMEVSSIDVLLDYLPWNLSIIRLPWMQQQLHVDWR